MKKILILLFILSVSYNLLSQNTINGKVFIDINKNGIFDKNEKGLKDVCISNGTEIVKTDKKGKYSIDVQDDNIVFVIKPSGYQFKLNEHYLPEFYYNHKPNGSPLNYKYKGVEPTATQPKEINFALYQQAEDTDFTFFVFGDPQPYSVENLNMFDSKIIDDIEDTKDISFGITLGDLVGDTLNLSHNYKNSIARIKLPWYNVMGNHDMNMEANDDKYSDETFERIFGLNNYSFNYSNAHFIILDDIIFPNPENPDRYVGGFRKDQLEFVKNDLKFVPKDKLIVISMHIPLLYHRDYVFRRDDRKILFDLLKDYENCLVLSAHSHIQQQYYHDSTTDWFGKNRLHEYNVGTTCGDWYSGELDTIGNPDATMKDGTPAGYAYIKVNNNKYNIFYKSAGYKPDYQISLHIPNNFRQKDSFTATIQANFFIGHKDNIVEYKINDGEWKKMYHTPNIDYNHIQKVLKFDNSNINLSGIRPSNPINSTHIWQVKFPKNLKKGINTVYVRATDSFNNTYYQKKEFNVL